MDIEWRTVGTETSNRHGKGKHYVAWVWVPCGASINMGNDREEHVGPEVNRKSRGIAPAVCY